MPKSRRCAAQLDAAQHSFGALVYGERAANEVFEREQNAKPRLAKKLASAKALEGKGDRRTRKKR